MEYIGDAVGRINSNSERLNDCKETEFWSSGFSWFHFDIQYGKKENWYRSVLVIVVLCILLFRKLYEELDDGSNSLRYVAVCLFLIL